jgi:hypothetical protein
VLVLHGTEDDTVPIEASQQLAQKFPCIVDLIEVLVGVLCVFTSS